MRWRAIEARGGLLPSRWVSSCALLFFLLGVLTASSVGAQTVPVVPATPAPAVAVPSISPLPVAPDSTRRPAAVMEPAEPTTTVTRRSGMRIVAVIAFITLTTLLLYNVRSR